MHCVGSTWIPLSNKRKGVHLRFEKLTWRPPAVELVWRVSCSVVSVAIGPDSKVRFQTAFLVEGWNECPFHPPTA